MKKNLFVTLVMCVLLSCASAQSTRFGFSGGLTMSNMMDKSTSGKTHGDYASGITLGVLLDVPMQKNGSFQPALNFVQKGTKNLDLGSSGTYKYNMTYLEMPLNIIFKFGKSNGKFIVGGGPSTAIALSGKRTLKLGNVQTKKSIKFGDSNLDDIKWIDFGANGVIGYEMASGFSIAFNYTYGITTLIINPAGENLFNRFFGLRAGFLLKGKQKK